MYLSNLRTKRQEPVGEKVASVKEYFKQNINQQN